MGGLAAMSHFTPGPNGSSLHYGPWCPTAYLRVNDGKLEQKMRRRVKVHPKGDTAYTRYEFEWQPIPQVEKP